MEKKARNTDGPKPLWESVEAEAKKTRASGKNRVVLLELKPEIEDTLARGYKWKVVWYALKKDGRIDMSYPTFRVHCRAIGLDTARGVYAKGKKPKHRRQSISTLTGP